MKPFLVAFSAMALLILASCSHSGAANDTKVSAGSLHTCVILQNKTIKCWGSNEDGQLGNGTGRGRSFTPVEVLGINNATQISAGGFNTCAVLSDKTIKCWGDNRYGQLGDGTGGEEGDRNLTQVEVLGIDNATQVSAGGGHTCALLENKTIKCWGRNNSGEIGDGTGGEEDDRSLTPVGVLEITNAIQVLAGFRHTCALLQDKTINCWGRNEDGQLGDGTGGFEDARSLIPVQVIGLDGLINV